MSSVKWEEAKRFNTQVMKAGDTALNMGLGGEPAPRLWDFALGWWCAKGEVLKRHAHIWDHMTFCNLVVCYVRDKQNGL